MGLGWIQIKKGMQLEAIILGPESQHYDVQLTDSFGLQMWDGGGNRIESQK